jgi:hypothetical protein
VLIARWVAATVVNREQTGLASCFLERIKWRIEIQMAIEPKQGEHAEPRYFEAIVRVLAPQIADLWGAGEYVPPFEFMISDADRHLVCGLEMNAEGVFQPLPETPNLLRARFPVSVQLVDSAGKTWEKSFALADLPFLEPEA